MEYKLGYYRTFWHDFPVVFSIKEICGDMDRIYTFFEEYAPYATKFRMMFWDMFSVYYDPNNDLKKMFPNTFDAIMYCIKELSDADAKIDFLGEDYDWRDENDC